MRRILRNNLPLAFTPLEIGCQRQPSDTFGVPSLTGLRFYLILSYAKNLKFFLEFVAYSDALSSLGLFLEYFYHLDIFHLEKLIIKLADGPKKIRRPKADYFIRVFA